MMDEVYKFKVGDKFVDEEFPNLGVATIVELTMMPPYYGAPEREYYKVVWSNTGPGGRFSDCGSLRLLTPLEHLL